MILPGAAAIGYTIPDRTQRLSLTLKIHMQKLSPAHRKYVPPDSGGGNTVTDTRHQTLSLCSG